MSVQNERFRFIHVQKTGGTWAVEAMRKAGVELELEGDKHTIVPADGRFTLAFVREPVSWYGSWWGHCHVIDRTWLESELDLPRHKHLNLSFDEYLKKQERFLTDFYESFIGPPENPIDFIGHYENLVEDLIRGLHEANVNFDEEVIRSFPPLYQSGNKEPCSAEARERIRGLESEVYERFYPQTTRAPSG